MDVPDTRYAKAADGTHVAYHVYGEGPIDLVFSFGWISNVDLNWELPSLASFLDRLGSFARVLVYDRRGAGLSDRALPDAATFDVGMDDIRAVMDAAGSARALQFGFQDGGMLNALFAASFPERAMGLVLMNSSPRQMWAPDHPWAWTSVEWDSHLADLEEGWGSLEHTRNHMSWIAPTHRSDDGEAAAFARQFQAGASPGSIVAIQRMLRDSDVRAVLPSIQVPTLVLHTIGNPVEPIEQGRYIAEQIAGATLVELPFDEHAPFWESSDAAIEEVRRFAQRLGAEEEAFDRVLATVLSTDVVDSTTLGDWFLATFDGPARAVKAAEAIAAGVRPAGDRGARRPPYRRGCDRVRRHLGARCGDRREGRCPRRSFRGPRVADREGPRRGLGPRLRRRRRARAEGCPRYVAPVPGCGLT